LQTSKTYNQKLDKDVRVIEQAPDEMGDIPLAAVEEATTPPASLLRSGPRGGD